MIHGSRTRIKELAATLSRQLVPVAFCLSVAATGCAAGVGTSGGTASGSVAPPATTAVSIRPTDPTEATVSGSPVATGVPAPQLLVLADGVQGGVGLWTYTGGTWAPRWPLPEATALARDGQTLVLGMGGSLELRADASPQTTVATISPRSGNQPLDGTIVGVDRSDAGVTAIAVSASGGLAFRVVATDGSTVELLPAPDSPFGPSVAWIDSQRLAVISDDARQIPRLAVVDTAKRTILLLGGLGGVRVFALSPDRESLAAATESAVYVAPVADWLGGKEPPTAASLEPSQVVWDLALSADGSRLAMLSGTEDASGVVAGIHELTYVRSGSGWSKETDSAAPFTRAEGQVWLG